MRICMAIICMLVHIGSVTAQGKGGDSSPPSNALVIPASRFEKAVAVIKEFEGWHTLKHHPYIGYGHKLLPGERLTANITEAQADSLLRADLLRRCHTFRRFGKDALLLAVLAYNVGEYRLLGTNKIPKSMLIRKLEAGDRDIYKEYISYRKWKGRIVPSIERRRKKEFRLLFVP